MQNRKVVALLVVSVILASFFTYVFASSPSATFTISSGVYPGAPSYTVYSISGTTYAKNQNGAVDYSGTDAATVIQSALNGLTAGRSIIEKIVLQGDFTASNILVGNYTEIEIQGKISLPNGVSSGTAIFKSASSSGFPLHSVYLHGGTLDGNAANNPSGGYGLSLYDLCNSRIDNIRFQYFREYCAYFNRVTESEGNFITNLCVPSDPNGEGNYGVGFYIRYMKDSKIEGISYESDTGSHGVDVYACRNSMFSNFMISAGSIGLYVHGSVEGCTFSNIDADYCYLYGIAVEGISPSIYKMPNKFIGCDSNYNIGHGWEIDDTARQIFIGCSAYHNNRGESGYSGFIIKGNSIYNKFIGCTSDDLADTPIQQYGFREIESADFNSFTDCEALGNVLGNFTTIGANTHVSLSWNGTSWIT
jgi:hypothetical protein